MVRHTEEARRRFARMALTDGVENIAKQADVKPNTIRDWIDRFFSHQATTVNVNKVAIPESVDMGDFTDDDEIDEVSADNKSNPIERMFNGERYQTLEELEQRLDYVSRNASYEARSVLASFSRSMDEEAVPAGEARLQIMADGISPFRANRDLMNSFDVDDTDANALFDEAETMRSQVIDIKHHLRRAHDARVRLADAVEEIDADRYQRLRG